MSLLSGLLSFVLAAFSVWAVTDVFLTPKENIRIFHKIFWLVVTVVLGPAAGLGWLLAGRPRKVGFLPGGNTGTLAQVAGDAGSSATARPSAPADSGQSTGFEGSADQNHLEEPAPDITTVIDLTESNPSESLRSQPAPLGPEDSEGWAAWAAQAVAENQSED